MWGGPVLLVFEMVVWVRERCRLLFLVRELSVLCSRYTLCRLLCWWQARSMNVWWGGGGGASGLVESRWA